jgi:hypothetical protein
LIIIYITYQYPYWIFLHFLICNYCIIAYIHLKCFFNYFMLDIKALNFYFYFVKLTRNPIMQSGQPIGGIIIVHNTKHGHQERTRTFDAFLKMLSWISWNESSIPFFVYTALATTHSLDDSFFSLSNTTEYIRDRYTWANRPYPHLSCLPLTWPIMSNPNHQMIYNYPHLIFSFFLLWDTTPQIAQQTAETEGLYIYIYIYIYKKKKKQGCGACMTRYCGMTLCSLPW